MEVEHSNAESRPSSLDLPMNFNIAPPADQLMSLPAPTVMPLPTPTAIPPPVVPVVIEYNTLPAKKAATYVPVTLPVPLIPTAGTATVFTRPPPLPYVPYTTTWGDPVTPIKTTASSTLIVPSLTHSSHSPASSTSPTTPSPQDASHLPHSLSWKTGDSLNPSPLHGQVSNPQLGMTAPVMEGESATPNQSPSVPGPSTSLPQPSASNDNLSHLRGLRNAVIASKTPRETKVKGRSRMGPPASIPSKPLTSLASQEAAIAAAMPPREKGKGKACFAEPGELEYSEGIAPGPSVQAGPSTLPVRPTIGRGFISRID